jgi:hypothetical protein
VQCWSHWRRFSTYAQETRGTIGGTVRDAQGVIPGAAVKVTNVDTNVAQSLVRDDRMQILNTNVMRVIPFGGGRSLQLRVDVVNALNDEQLLAPNLDPTSTQFGMVTNAQNSVGRWITFMTKLTF